MDEIILAIGAHPDDIELGCGATLRRHKREGDRTYGLVISRGERGEHDLTGTECRDSAKVLGLEDIKILEFRDGAIVSDGDVVNEIEKYIIRYKPTIIYTHSAEDRHQDHRNVAPATCSAVRIPGVSIYHYESPSCFVSFSPHHFVCLQEEDIEKKLEALRHYKSQLEKKSVLNLDWVMTRAKQWGYQEANGKCNGEFYAEVFEINHSVWRLR